MMKPRHKSVLLARSQCYQQIGDNDLALADANDIVAQDAASVKVSYVKVSFVKVSYMHVKVLNDNNNNNFPLIITHDTNAE